MSDINVDLLRRVKEKILAEPDQFVMHSFFYIYNEAGVAAPNCGTAACIGGWAISLSTSRKPSECASERYLSLEDSGTRAAKLLGLDGDEADRLFRTRSWPWPFWSMFENAKTMKEKAQVAANRIDHFITYRT